MNRHDEIGHSLRENLSGLEVSRIMQAEMMEKITGGVKVKRKLTVGLVLALCLMLAAVSALAVTLWKNYYDKIAQNEGEIGSYDTWSGEKRAEFVLAMQAEGVVFDQEQMNILANKGTSDADKAKIATDLILGKYPGMREDTITAISILEAEKGILPTWSMEDKAAYTQMLVKTKTLGHDEEMYWLPGVKDIPRDRAVAIANEAIIKEYDESQENLKTLTWYSELRSYAHEKEHRTWHVYYMKRWVSVYDAPSEYSVWINSQTGEVESVGSPAQQAGAENAFPEHIQIMWQELIGAYRESEPFTIESLVRLKAEWTERLEELKQYTKYWSGMRKSIKNAIEQDIRMPEEGSILLSDAWEKAEAAVLALPDWTKEKLDMYGRFAEVYYHSNELGKPVYHLFFSPKQPFWPEFAGKPVEYYGTNYAKPLFAQFGGDFIKTPRYVAVRLDAKTGELTEVPVVAMHTNHGAMPSELELIK